MASIERQFGAGALASSATSAPRRITCWCWKKPTPPTRRCASRSAPLCGPFNEQAARTQFGPAFGSVELQRTIANANYNALEASMKGSTHGLDLLASYTYSKSIDQSSGLPEPVNPVNPSLSRALSAFDLRQNLVTSFHYAAAAAQSATATAELATAAGDWPASPALLPGCR
jgi:hypothetical protein